ncbi:hypothetical protein T4C_156 [Trichinella pseudospiralis]|uniref:Uncharacterized protein n=1 Tax=Trichinella pseudospiralis TaxID=6337 RepID=A0A0V1ITT5_TRIPS|nr:hypothetical protein T4C_156 [Trichinella pseudospiralis]
MYKYVTSKRTVKQTSILLIYHADPTAYHFSYMHSKQLGKRHSSREFVNLKQNLIGQFLISSLICVALLFLIFMLL